MRAKVPPILEVVLLGGGHSHVQVLRSFGMRPLDGVRVTVVSREVFTPYSGMLPGHVAGLYGWRDIHIDLGPLARFAGARLIPHEVVGLDASRRLVEIESHPALRYDLLSVNSGAAPARLGDCGIAVKPIGRFLPHWREVKAQARRGERVCLVGGGAGGVELALAMRHALAEGIAVTLLTDTLLPGQNHRAVAKLREALQRCGIELIERFRATGAETVDGEHAVLAEDGRVVRCEHLFWVTGVTAPGWLRESGLTVDDEGFVVVDPTLRSLSHPEVFATGDAAALHRQPRPKAGVFAVREGPVLAENLRRAVVDGRLLRYRAQSRFLTIMGTGDGRAVASRGAWAASGRWVWRWKDSIDRRFMARFNRLPEMPSAEDVPEGLRGRLPEPMRCGGCGAKLGADPLRRVLSRLPDQRPLEARQGVVVGIGEDAAVIRHDGASLLLTVDGFRSLVDDAYLFGRITAHHSLNDILAMGGRGVAALAMATVPLMADAMMEEELYQLLRGAVEVLNQHEVPLVGGHSAEGGELSLALSITGVEAPPRLTKGALLPGDALLLNKTIGTGAVLAADMRARADSNVVAAALAGMDRSNAAALDVLRCHEVHALTDVSGFGLLGHLGEMLRAARLGARLRLDAVPFLPGARELVAQGLVSSLQATNEQALADYDVRGIDSRDPRLRLLADPQTSGGLLAAVAEHRAQNCIETLRAAGYPEAAVIGTVTAEGWQVVV